MLTFGCCGGAAPVLSAKHSMDILITNKLHSLQSFTFSKLLRILVLAPHPDDFDAIGVSMRNFWKNGNPLYLAVATSGEDREGVIQISQDANIYAARLMNSE